MTRMRWPEGDGIEIRDGEPYVAGTDFPIREVRGFSVVGAVRTMAYLAEDYGDTLTKQQIAAAVRYYDAHEFLIRALDEGEEQP